MPQPHGSYLVALAAFKHVEAVMERDGAEGVIKEVVGGSEYLKQAYAQIDPSLPREHPQIVSLISDAEEKLCNKIAAKVLVNPESMLPRLNETYANSRYSEEEIAEITQTIKNITSLKMPDGALVVGQRNTEDGNTNNNVVNVGGKQNNVGVRV
jgi:hypothetical protein